MPPRSSLRASLPSSVRSLGLRLPRRPREERTSSVKRARSFAESAAQRLPTITPPRSSTAHGTALAPRFSFDLLGPGLGTARW